MKRDLLLIRSPGKRKGIGPPRTARQQEARRGAIRHFSGKSRNLLLLHVRNTHGYTHFLTLTYAGKAPSDGRTVKGHLERLNRWFLKKGIFLVWKQEFCSGGRPHFHMMLSEGVTEEEVGQKWASLIGSEPSPRLAVLELIRRPEAVEWYMAKPEGDPSNRVPNGFRDMGRWWGHAGPGSKPRPLLTLVGREADLAALLRPIKKATERKTGRKPRRDNGLTNQRHYGAGGEAMAQDVVRLAESIGFVAVDLATAMDQPAEEGAVTSVSQEVSVI